MAAGEHKRCPDCAEMVLAAARTCRYCGYRMEEDAPGRASSSMLDLVRRRPTGASSLPELLAQWGAELAPGEDVGYFGFCTLDSSYGFLLVTSARVAFFARRGQRRLLEWPLDELRAVESRGGRRSRGVLVTGPDRSVRLADFASRAARAEVARRLGGAG